MPGATASAQEEADLLKSGGSLGRHASARAGFMPLSIDHVVLPGLAGIPIFLRNISRADPSGPSQFVLYSGASTTFAESHRVRLKAAGAKFVYIPLADQMQFRRQVEEHLAAMVLDPAVAVSTKSELIYETSVELVNELLVEQDLAGRIPRLEAVARTVATFAINNADAFSHLFAASQHDFYTATHMVNVGTWMAPLAYALGIHGIEELKLMCVAGMVHDIGKIFVSEEILNKKGKLTEREWQELRAHAQRGFEHLKSCGGVDETVLRVVHEHHERMDGRGYPRGLRSDQIHLAARICAVVDSFDAMTAFRPFKERTETFGDALRLLAAESPAKYDPDIVSAWTGLMRRAERDGAVGQPLETQTYIGLGRRKHQRFAIECPARLHAMELVGDSWTEGIAMPIKAHNLSRAGLGFLSSRRAKVSQYVRVYLLGTGTLADRVFEGQIVHCRDYSDGWHDVGMRFAPLDSEISPAVPAIDPATGD